MTKIAFVITKPFQLMVSIAIIDEMRSPAEITFLITDDFFEAKEVFKNIQLHLNLPSVKNKIFFKNQRHVFTYLTKNKYDKIFIDSDVGFKRWIEIVRIKLSNKNLSLFVYEEGVGTYRDDLYKNDFLSEQIKLKVFSFLGVGTYFGGNFLTKAIHLFKPESYPFREKNVIKINKSLLETITKYYGVLRNIFPIQDELISILKDRSDQCIIYLSSWYVDEMVLSSLIHKYKHVIIKPHPHIKSTILNKNITYCVNHSVPAEILIIEASRCCKTIKIYHHGSSVTRYITNENIEYIKIN